MEQNKKKHQSAKKYSDDDYLTKKFRNWVFTWNNYPENYKEILADLSAKYLICGEEIAPTTGTPHLQGYMEFENPRIRKSIFKKCKGMGFAEAANAEAAPNEKYTSKDGKTFTYGDHEVKQQGKRNDLLACKKIIDNGGSMLDVAEQSFGDFCRYFKGFEKYLILKYFEEGKKLRNIEVHVHWGRTNTGKTHDCIVDATKNYNSAYYMTSEGNTGLWWTNYNFEKLIIIDDFRCNTPLHILLRWLDKYPVQIPVHGNYYPLLATKIYITSNTNPLNWYDNCDDESRLALMSRINVIKLYKVKGEEPEIVKNSFDRS